jgi:hypothetical protein
MHPFESILEGVYNGLSGSRCYQTPRQRGVFLCAYCGVAEYPASLAGTGFATMTGNSPTGTKTL